MKFLINPSSIVLSEDENANLQQTVKNKNKSKKSKTTLHADDKSPSTSSKQNQKKKVTVIVGDSILKNIQGWSLSDSNNHVVVKPFPGATITDMEDFIKPIIRKEPEDMILHIGTNDVKKLTPRCLAEGITNLAIQIQQESPNTGITISGILPRNDNLHLEGKINETNRSMEAICKQHKWNFVNCKTIDKTCLNSRGLHLNRKGSSVLTNFYSELISNN